MLSQSFCRDEMAERQEQPARLHSADIRTHGGYLEPPSSSLDHLKTPRSFQACCDSCSPRGGSTHTQASHQILQVSLASWGLGNAKDGLVPHWQPWQRKIPFRNPHIYQAHAGGREWDLGVYSPFIRNVSFHKEKAQSQLMAIL